MILVALAILGSTTVDPAPSAPAPAPAPASSSAAAPVNAVWSAAKVAAKGAKPADDPDKVICHVEPKTGSRLTFTRVCMTEREWSQNIHEQATYLEKQEAAIPY